MNSLTTFVLFAWIPVVMGLFALMRPMRAVITAYLVAWLFLPLASFQIAGFPDYTKTSATSVGILLAAAIFDGRRLFAFSPRWFDMPMLVWCLCPGMSSLVNGLGVHDAISAVMYQTFAWGLPFLIGRVYFNDLESVRELAIGFFIGGMVYVPLCLFEIRMSPKLHQMVYGYSQVGYSQSYRFGGWRPMVFLQHGLMVAMWMCMTSLVGLWLWWTGTVRRLAGFPMGLLAVVLLATAIMCRSMGSLVLLAGGIGVMMALKILNLRVAIVILALIPPVYIGLRVSGMWTGAQLLDASSSVSEDRAASLNVRLDNEQKLAAHAMEQPIFGWGGWGRNRLHDAKGKDISITDGFWVIALGSFGLVGLGSFLCSFLMPGLYFMLRVPQMDWCRPPLAPLAVLVVVVTLFVVDCIPNAMINPVFAVMAGAITSCITPGVLYAPQWRYPVATALPSRA